MNHIYDVKIALGICTNDGVVVSTQKDIILCVSFNASFFSFYDSQFTLSFYLNNELGKAGAYHWAGDERTGFYFSDSLRKIWRIPYFCIS